jgi:hypothetical protein
MQAPEIFKAKEGTAALSLPIDQQDIQNSINEAVQQQIESMVPSEFITQLFNLVSWSIFAVILVFAGAKVSAIGIKMLFKNS